jgi:hypothetical protein
MTKALTKKQSTELASVFEVDPSGGFENVTAQSIMLPRLTVLQPTSPQLVEGKQEYFADAKAGDIFDAGLGKVLGRRVEAVPAHYSQKVLHWAPLSSGQGLLGQYDASDPAVSDMRSKAKREGSRMIMPDGSYLADAHQLALVIIPDLRPAFVSFQSTQIKKSRRLLTAATSEIVNGRTAPLWYRKIVLGTQPEQNQHGHWHGWTIERAEVITELSDVETILSAVKVLRGQIADGDARADHREAPAEVEDPWA